MPDSRLTINLAPADIPKEGSSFDLPIAVGILAASGMIDKASLRNSLFLGELSLSARSYFKIIKVAQTIADLNCSIQIEASYIAEALQYCIKEE